MFLRGVALATGGNYTVLHGMDEGVGIARAIDRMTLSRFAYIAEVHHPESVDRQSLEHASAVIVPDEDTLSRFPVRPPMARVSVLPDPHAELADNAFTTAEFTAAIDGIYTYVLRKHPEIER
jgi:hypothetical protein